MMPALPLAVTITSDYVPPDAPAFDFHRLLLRLILWTIFLLALCLAVILLSKRRRHPATTTDRMQVEATVPLTRSATLYVVRIEEQTVAVLTDAAGLRGMTLLTPSFSDSPPLQTE